MYKLLPRTKGNSVCFMSVKVSNVSFMKTEMNTTSRTLHHVTNQTPQRVCSRLGGSSPTHCRCTLKTHQNYSNLPDKDGQCLMHLDVLEMIGLKRKGGFNKLN